MAAASRRTQGPDEKQRPLLTDLQTHWTAISRGFANLGGGLSIAALLALVGFLLLGTKQGADLAHTVVEARSGWRGPVVKMLMLALTSGLLGGEAWFWSRRMIEQACGLDRETWKPRALLEVFPRVLAALPFAFAAVAFLRSGEKLGTLAVVLVVLGVVFTALLALRQWAVEKIDARVADGSGTGLPGGERRPAARLVESAVVAFSALRREKLAQGFIRLSLAGALLTMILFVLAPVRPAQFLGAISVVYLGAGLIVPVMSWLILRGRRLQLPILGTLLLATALWSWIAHWTGTNHAVGRRAFGGGWDQGPQMGARPNFPDAFAEWWDHAPGAPGQPKPMIVVAAAGGASRAGYWSASVLGDLQERSAGRFSGNLFAISSVSGGSVGSAAFLSQLYDSPRAQGFAAAVRDTAGGDFLSPSIGGLLFPDLAQRFLPTLPVAWSPGAVLALPDRAEALESAFERGWSDHCGGHPCGDKALWSKPLQALWSDPARRVPLLFINGARQEDGRRVITSRVVIDSAEFPDAVDFYGVTQGRDLAVSSAIHNGARFPLVSPGGVLLDQAGRANGHILDGGYFENSGLTTAGDVIRAAQRVARVTGRPIRPIVIELNNDSDIPPNSPSFDRGWQVRRLDDLAHSRTDYFLSGVMGPLSGLASSRDGRATATAIRLSQDLGADYVLFRLSNFCDEKPSPRKAPMDWVLSDAAKRMIQRALTCNSPNQQATARVLSALPPVDP